MLNNLFEMFPNISKEKVKIVFSKLSLSEKELLFSCFGKDLSEKRWNFLSNNDVQAIIGILNSSFINKLENDSLNVSFKSVFQYFPEYEKTDIIKCFFKLSNGNMEIIQKVYGKNLDLFIDDSSLDEIIEAEYIILCLLKKEVLRYQKELSRKKSSYKRITLAEEQQQIKKALLSFYNDSDVTQEDKLYFLDYYFEVFPDFKDKFCSSDDKEGLLNEEIKKSKVFRDNFLMQNYRLVWYAINKKNSNEDPAELFQEGMIGMILALKKYRFHHNARFSTYSLLWIRRFIDRYIIEKSKMIRITSDFYSKVNTYRNIYFNFLEGHNRKPKLEEISSLTGFSDSLIHDIESYLANEQNVASLNVSIGLDDDFTLEQLIPSDEENFTDVVDNDILSSQFLKMIMASGLSDQARKILFLRYGLWDGRVYTYDEIASEFQVSRERIKKIEIQSLRVLKNDKRVQRFYDEILGNKGSEEFSQSHNIKQILLTGNLSSLNALEILILDKRYMENFSSEMIARELSMTVYDVVSIEERAVSKLLNNYQDAKILRKEI